MSELSNALRNVADRIERGELLVDASQCALVLGNDAGAVQATYIGRTVPASGAGIHLLAAGIQRFNNDAARQAQNAGSQMPFAAVINAGSTH